MPEPRVVGLACSGGGCANEIGKTATVVERRRNLRGPRYTVFVSTVDGRKVLEGGQGRAGEIYVSWPETTGRGAPACGAGSSRC